MLKEIQEIKNEKLICLDFDDCIIEYRRKENGKWINNEPEEIFRKLADNCYKIDKFCIENGYKVFIISSWSCIINNDLTLKKYTYDRLMKEWFDVIQQLNIIGKDPFNDRILAMEVLLENDNKIICIDDLDMSAHFEWSDKFCMINYINGVVAKNTCGFTFL
jgi:hypothetical protein